MLCEHCLKKMIPKRSLWNLFEPEIHHLCEMCYQMYPLLPTHEVVPIEGGHADVFTLIAKPYPVTPIAYQSFYQSYYVLHQTYFKDYILLIFDVIKDEMWQFIDHLSFGNLMIVRLYENSHDKGEEL